MLDTAPDKNRDGNAVPHWTDCWTMRELGDLERPSFSEWLRHLAGQGNAPVPAAATA